MSFTKRQGGYGMGGSEEINEEKQSLFFLSLKKEERTRQRDCLLMEEKGPVLSF
jgi:hypothetical protein